MRNKFGFGARSASPAKRTAAERDNDHIAVQAEDKNVGPAKKSVELDSVMPSRAKVVNNTANTNPDHAINKRTSAATLGSDDSTSMQTTTPSTEITTASPPTSLDSDTGDLPSFDEQVQIVTDLAGRQVQKEGAEGYLIARDWLVRVLSRTSDGVHNSSMPKTAREGPVGPVDNSTIADLSQSDLKDAAGKQFIPLKAGTRLGDDFEIISYEAWTKIIRWYGKSKGTPEMIRIMHDTADVEAASENLLYELYPPVITVQKLHNGGDFGMSALANKVQPAVQMVASRSESYQKFLVRIKKALKINESVKIRIWKRSYIHQSTEQPSLATSSIPTPASSRGASPTSLASTTPAKPKLIIDLAAFNAMAEGSERELLPFKDHTMNEKYNGHSTLALAGFSENQWIIVEEQSRGDLYVSEYARAQAKQHGVDLSIPKNETTKALELNKSKSEVVSSSRESSVGAMTRSRFHKNGRSRGTVGLQNLGNTCYMNSALQCIRSVEELTLYFLQEKYKPEINTDNPLGYHGSVAKSYAGFVENVYQNVSSFAPRQFKGTLGRVQPLFSGYGQQDSQEFLSFLVDALHEDLNRVHKKPYRENPDSDDKTVHDPEAIQRLGQVYRENHQARNNSIIMDLFSGFYKNTMVCPVCDKVSVTFDPYSSVTLQLPIETPWSHTITVWPLNAKPIQMEVELDKNSTVRALKTFVARRLTSLKPNHLVLAEIFSEKFYKVFEDSDSLSEGTVNSNDKLDLFELDRSPTNWFSETKRPRGSLITDEAPTMDSPIADRMAVPLYHRVRDSRDRPSLELWPTIITITRDEAKDYDLILRRVLYKVNSMTTLNLLEETGKGRVGQLQNHGDGETSSVTDDDAHEDAKIQARSVEGEDGLVDISMTGTESPAHEDKRVADADILDAGKPLDPGLKTLFSMCYFSAPSEPFPCGYSGVNDRTRYPTIYSRLQQMQLRSPRTITTSNSGSQALDQNSVASSDDELSQEPTLRPAQLEAGSDSDADMGMSNMFSAENGSARPRNSLQRIKAARRQGDSDESEYLLRLREGIVLDWDSQAFETIFAGEQHDDLRGHPSFDKRDIETFHDPELEAKQTRRNLRKKNGVSLIDCFEETAKSEVLSEENAWYCGRCKELRRATKTLELWTTPDILVLHLKRFSSQSRLRDKVDVLVDFPIENLDLSGRIGLPEGKSQVYDLFAVDNHYGGLGGGHYTAYAQNFYDKKWYNHDDSSVSEVRDPDNVVTRAAYLLFYRRRSPNPLGPPYVAKLVDEAYAADESGEDQRGDDPYSPNGLSNASPPASAAAAASHPRQPNTSGGGALGGSGERDVTATPAYEDEGVDVGGPDDPLPSYEDAQAHVEANARLSRARTAHEEWSWANVPLNVNTTSRSVRSDDTTAAASDVAAGADSDVEERQLGMSGNEDSDYEMHRRHASRVSLASDVSSSPDSGSAGHARLRTVGFVDDELADESVMEIRNDEDS